MGSSSVIRWMVFHMMVHAPLTWASEINCYFNGEVIGSRRQISLARNVEKHHRFWGTRALRKLAIDSSRVWSARKRPGRHWQTSPTCRTKKPHISKLVSISQLWISLLSGPRSQHVIGLDCGLLIGHNAVWFPNFYMLCSDLLSVINRKFGISYGWFPV